MPTYVLVKLCEKNEQKNEFEIKVFFLRLTIRLTINDNNEDVEFYFVKQNSKNKLDFII